MLIFKIRCIEGHVFVSNNNRLCLSYQYYNRAPWTSIFGVVFFVSKSLLGIERQKKLTYTIFT